MNALLNADVGGRLATLVLLRGARRISKGKTEPISR